MGCCQSKNACVDGKPLSCLKHEGLAGERFSVRDKGVATKSSNGSSTIGTLNPNESQCCSSNEGRNTSESSETSVSISIALPTAGEETDRDNVWPSAGEESCTHGSPKARRIGSYDENKAECEQMESTVVDSDPTSSGRRESGADEKDDISHIISGLKASNLFYMLDDVTLFHMASKMKKEVYHDGEVIICQGEMPKDSDCMYCVAKGEVELHISGSHAENSQIVTKRRGWVFGDVALLFNSPRTASVIAKGSCVLYALDRRSFIQIGTHVPQIRMLRFLRKLPFLKRIGDNKLAAFSREAELKSRQAQNGLELTNNTLYIIRKGKIRVTAMNRDDNPYIMSRGNVFEADLANAYDAVTDVEFIAVRQSAIEKLGTFDLYEQIAEETVLEILELIGGIDVGTLDLAEVIRKHPPISATKRECLIERGQSIEHLYVIIRGVLKIRATTTATSTVLNKSNKTEDINNDDNDSQLPNGLRLKRHNGAQFFGVDWNRPTKSDVDVLVASTKAQILMIPHALLSRTEAKPVAMQKVSNRVQLSPRVVEAQPQTYSGSKIRFKDLRQYRVVGEGEYGSVRLVVHEPTGIQYALKIMHKAAIRDTKTAEHVIMERKMLVRLDGRKFLVGLRGAYQDEKSIYMLMDWVPGGELFSRIIGCGGRLPDSHAVFYAANVVLAYRQMHRQNIIYRDLKPENMLIDTNGYLKLADYGFATLSDGAAWTVCGTPDYQAPEIISRQGASKASDFWALGVLIYEMLTGDAPFKSPTDDRWDTHRRILSGKFHIPEYVSPSAGDLIHKLLQVDPTRRLGFWEEDLEKVQTHPWFKKVDWKRLGHQRQPAPFLPVLKDGMDTSCFDYYDSPTKCDAPAAQYNFFGRDRPWSSLWEWIEDF